ncbi:MAG TPA: hypothetical protein PLM56_06605 [Cyclobacteriaceae bacterium]|jgi:hypothetical protein|nr:hypothetical protein [Cytophagales bacterium]HMR56455.1 hypothetical protein [Cyclobacteriaceae bacterium]HRE66975.1 hypothetical protein [Cyclobacteriaceae bacterium]HRF33149.1 hypothetical protein [Cyclobacteriaceae bacterium]
MKNEDKIVELLAEMVKGQDKLIEEVSEMKTEIFKQGLQTSENSRAILKLADEIRLVAEHEKRIAKLEVTVFK